MSEVITRKFIKKYCVEFFESEIGYGQKLEKEYYDTEEQAKEAVQKCNSFNTDEEAPDWYMVAKYLGPVEIEI